MNVLRAELSHMKITILVRGLSINITKPWAFCFKPDPMKTWMWNGCFLGCFLSPWGIFLFFIFCLIQLICCYNNSHLSYNKWQNSFILSQNNILGILSGWVLKQCSFQRMTDWPSKDLLLGVMADTPYVLLV